MFRLIEYAKHLYRVIRNCFSCLTYICENFCITILQYETKKSMLINEHKL